MLSYLILSHFKALDFKDCVLHWHECDCNTLFYKIKGSYGGYTDDECR